MPTVINGAFSMQQPARYRKNQHLMNRPKEEESFDEKLRNFRHDIKSSSFLKSKANNEPQKMDKAATFAPNQNLFMQWDDTLSVDEQLEKLNKNLSKLDSYSYSSGITVVEAMEHFASQYSIYNEYIKKNGSTEQKEKFEQMMNRHVDNFAKSFSEQVGGFFEKNGLTGEQQRVYESVRGRIQMLTDSYAGFLKTNGDQLQALAAQPGDDNVCLAFELRRLYHESGDGELFSIGGAYTRTMLSDLESLAKSAQDILASKDFGAVSEEELGVRLGKTFLNGLSVLEKSKAAFKFKDAFQNAITSHMDSAIDKSNELISKKRNSTEQERPLDKGAIELVIQSMVDSYNHSKSIPQAIKAGNEFAMHIYLFKKDSYGNVERYQSSEYFERLLSDTLERSDNDLSRIQRAALVNIADYQKRLNAQSKKTSVTLNAYV